MSEIHPKITEVLTETFKVPAAEIIPEATMDSLEMDSLAVAEFAVIIKETLGIDADSDSLLKGATLAEITAFLNGARTACTVRPAHAAHALRAVHAVGTTSGVSEANEAPVGVGR
ncbi:putative acyl carrier protein [Streptomyces sp. L-9-10]|nr:putative acyl carrier protein [Streptomyces sp. L-9-10]